MLHKTRAIALRYIRYKDSSIIAKILTEDFGLLGFVVNGVRSTKSKISPGLFQPLTLLDLVHYHDEKRELHRLNEIKPAWPMQSIPFHPAKTSMVLFASELISAVIREGQANTPLFDLVWDWITTLDLANEHFESEHIKLAYQLLSPLGIVPEHWEEIFPTALQPKGFRFNDVASLFEPERVVDQSISNGLKQWSLDMILYYMAQHFEGMGKIHSLEVLRAVFK